MTLNKVQGQRHMDLPWLWVFCSNYRDSSVGQQVRHFVRLGFSPTSTLLDRRPPASQPSSSSPTRDVFTHCLAVPSHGQHQGNEARNKTPHLNGKLTGLGGRRKALRLVTVQGTKRLGHLLFACFSLRWEKGHGESLLTGRAPFPKIAKEL